jgi:hypothetical protein
MATPCILVKVLKDQDNSRVNLSKSKIFGTVQLVSLENLVEDKDFKEVY